MRPSRSSSDDEPRRFQVQRRRLGEIRYIEPNGNFGFIDAEDFREDVFFHKSVWQSEWNGTRRELKVGLFVEFEIDEAYKTAEKKLRATTVQMTNRPRGRKLTGRDAPHLINLHHPKARQRRPTWRGGTKSQKPVDPGSESDGPDSGATGG